MTPGIDAQRAGSTYQMPMRMKSVSGRSFPIVSALTTQDDCLTPTTQIHVSTSVSIVTSAMRGGPAASTGQ